MGEGWGYSSCIYDGMGDVIGSDSVDGLWTSTTTLDEDCSLRLPWSVGEVDGSCPYGDADCVIVVVCRGACSWRLTGAGTAQPATTYSLETAGPPDTDWVVLARAQGNEGSTGLGVGSRGHVRSQARVLDLRPMKAKSNTQRPTKRLM